MKAKQLLISFTLIIGLYACNNHGGNSNGGYQQQVQSVEEIERSEPTNFLSVVGTYNTNFWGDKFKIEGSINNAATVATYKDAVIKVTFYSKTKTELGSSNYTVYDFFPPHGQKKFELKVDKVGAANSVGLEVVGATAQ